MYVPCRIRRAHLWSKGWQIRHVLRKAGIEGEISLEDNDNENPKDIDNDKTEINDKDFNIKVFDESFCMFSLGADSIDLTSFIYHPLDSVEEWNAETGAWTSRNERLQV